ncbi:MAG: hypothetical protein ACRCVJ_18565 [Clostridium sp.]
MIKSEVECPYCYAIYDIEKIGNMTFECVCESTLDILFDKEGIPYIDLN